MRNLSTDTAETANLFAPDAVVADPSIAMEKEREDGKSSQDGTSSQAGKLAKDFVRWCFSFGDEFHNSPDVINLRFWMNKLKFKADDVDEAEVLLESRRLFMKKIDQSVRKADVSHEAPHEQQRNAD